MRVVVVEGCDVEVQVRPDQAPISGFVADQVFRRELPVANDAEECQRIGTKECSKLEVFVNPGRCAHSAGNGGPYGLLGPHFPEKPCTGFNLETAVVIVQEFGPDG